MMNRPQYQIAGRLQQSTDLTRIDAASDFATELRRVVRERRPRRIVETGTYRGTGTTTVIGRALVEADITDAEFVSIEVNPRHAARAFEHAAREHLPVHIEVGLSVPRDLLPTRDAIERELVDDVIADGLVVDHEPERRAELYLAETDYPDAPDDLLGRTLRAWDGRPDLVVLDSGGHMGWAEFRYLLTLLRGPCWVALDDVRHVKHYRSLRAIAADPRFAIAACGDEKFGYCLARFDPAAGAAERAA